MVEDMAERLRLAFDVDVLQQAQDASTRAGYAVTLIRAGNTLHGWRFPAEVLRRAVARFEGSSCFLNHVGWFQQAASVGDLVGVISDVEYGEVEGALTGRLTMSLASQVRNRSIACRQRREKGAAGDSPLPVLAIQIR